MKKSLNIILIAASIIFISLSIKIIMDNQDFKEFNYETETNKLLFYKLNAISTYYMDSFENKLEVFKAAKEKPITLNKMKEITKLNLNNEYCERLDKDFTVDNAIACVDEHYNLQNIDNYMRVEIYEIKELRKKSKQNISILTSNIIYYLEDMDRISIAENKNYSKVANLYKDLKNKIENDLSDIRKNI